MDSQTKDAWDTVAEFVADRPDFLLDPDIPTQGATNRVFYGRHNETPIVYKYFGFPPRWRNELYCLRHYAGTGVVPAVVASIPDKLIVMSRLPGHYVTRKAELTSMTADQIAALSRQVGRAIGKLADTPLPGPDATDCPPRDFQIILWNSDVRAAIESYLAICRAVRRVIPEYGGRFGERSLHFIASHIDAASAMRGMFFHEDIGNAMALDGEFVGFFDLEMCRIGTVAMQLGVALCLCGAGRLDWSELTGGVTRQTGIEISPDGQLAILAMHHLYHWIRACRWGWWDGSPGSDHHAAAARDASHHCGRMAEAVELIRPYAPVSDWFPP